MRPRRFWSDDEKRRIVAETFAPGVSVSAVARRYRMNANLLFTWLRDPRFAPEAVQPQQLLPVDVTDEAPIVERRHACTATSADSIEIELANGARLRCAADIDPTMLVRLLSAIERAS